MGKTSTHAVVMAQMYTQGKCQGIHPFIVQLRSLEDHTSLPGKLHSFHCRNKLVVCFSI